MIKCAYILLSLSVQTVCNAFVPVSTTRGLRVLSQESRSRARAPRVLCAGSGSSAEQSALARFDKYLQHEPHECLQLLKDRSLDGETVVIDNDRASALLTQIGNAVLKSDESSEEDIIFVYNELHSRGLLKGYGSINMNLVPYTEKDVSVKKLESLIGMNMRSLAPGSSENIWLYAGAIICLIEYTISQANGLDPLQVVIPSTIGFLALDRLLLKGAIVESIARIVVPNYKEKIVRHEAGHFLLAYLLGCPVTGCVLDPWKVGDYVKGGQAGTIFIDPSFARGMQKGQLHKSLVDRFSIILMSGIASEAITYGKAEGGLSDESQLIDVLSSIKPAFTYDQIKIQARWAAVQAVLLLKEHESAYNALVEKLKNNASLGECIMTIEKEIALHPSSSLAIRRNNQQQNLAMRNQTPSSYTDAITSDDNSNQATVLRKMIEDKLNASLALQDNSASSKDNFNSVMQQLDDDIKRMNNDPKSGTGKKIVFDTNVINQAKPSSTAITALDKNKSSSIDSNDTIERRLLQVEARLKEINQMQQRQ